MRGISLACGLMLFFGTVSLGQDSLSYPSIPGMKFRSVGPALTAGRISDLAVNPHNPREYYVAVASGGVWKTQNNGVSYQPLFDEQNVYSIGCLALDPKNPSVIWVGTGENNNQRSVAYGDGVYRSRDGGQSWEHMGLENSEHIGMICVHPENSQVIYVAAYGPLWSAGGQRGIYQSKDGGQNWERILHVSENTGFNEIHLDPRDPNVLYAAAHQRRRHVWTYVSGGPESAVYKSEDGGKSWRKLESGLPKEKGRIGLAISPANPDLVYAMVEGHGTYLSRNRGESFQKQNDYETSGNYYVELVPHPSDPATVYSMDTYMHLSRDYGQNWERVPEKNKHVDNHCLWIDPKQPEHMIAGCDGGIYETWDNAAHWHYKPNLPITQFYRVALDNAEPFYHIYGGTQDNFSLGGPSQTINDRGIVNSDWYITNTGDGFESQIDPENPNIVYAQAQYGWLVRYDKISGEKVGIKPSPNRGDKPYRWNWDAPLLVSPHNPAQLYFAANVVFRSKDRGNNWQVISPDLTRQIDRHKLPVMGEIQSADAISYDRSTSVYGNITALEESPLEEDLLYVGTDDGLIQISEDGGQNWRKVEQFPGIPDRTYVNQILADRYNADVVYAVFNNHKNGDFKPYLLKSTDRGRSWQSRQGNLPENGALFVIKQDHENPDLFFAGTEFGLFFSVNGGEQWQTLKNGLPTIAVRDLEIQARENDLVLATFGRSFYVLDDYSALRDLLQVKEKKAHLFPVNQNLLYQQASPLGYSKAGFLGASYYMGENPPLGLAFDLYLKEVPKTAKQKRKAREKKMRKAGDDVHYPPLDSLRAEAEEEKAYLLFVIRDSSGQEIRRFTKQPTKGLQRYYWDGRLANRSEVKVANAPLTNSGGAQLAKPGNYQVEIFLGHAGRLDPLLDEAQQFALRWLKDHSFQIEDPANLVAFQDSLEEARRRWNGVRDWHQRLLNRNGKLTALARNTPGAPLSLLKDLQKVQEDLRALKIEISGDATRSKYNFESLPSLNSRIGSAVWNSYGSTAEPTGEQRKNLAWVQEATRRIGNQLEKLEVQQDQYYQILLNNGSPVLDGEMR